MDLRLIGRSKILSPRWGKGIANAQELARNIKIYKSVETEYPPILRPEWPSSQGEGLHTPYRSDERCQSLREVATPKSPVSHASWNREESLRTPQSPTQSKNCDSVHPSWSQTNREGMRTRPYDRESCQRLALKIRKAIS